MFSIIFSSLLPRKIASRWHSRSTQWLQRRIPAGQHALNARSVFILPTRQGIYLALFLIAMLLACINYNLSLGYMLTFFVFSVALGAMSRTYQNLVGLECTLLSPAAAQGLTFAGDTATVTVQLKNTTRINKLALKLGFKTQPWLPVGKPQPVELETMQALDANSVKQVSLSLPCPRRGLHPVPPFTIASAYPLGLWRAWSYVFHLPAQTHGVWVYPAPRTPLPFMASLNAERGDNSAMSTHFSAHGDALSHIEAADSASARSIHWPSFAKGQVAQKVLENAEPHGAQVLLSLAGCTASGIEAQLEQLCAAVLYCRDHRIAFTLELGGQSMPELRQARCDEAHVLACLQALALYEFESH